MRWLPFFHPDGTTHTGLRDGTSVLDPGDHMRVEIEGLGALDTHIGETR